MHTTDQHSQWIDAIDRLPGQLEQLLAGMTPDELTGHFLPGEWTVAQNVHHLADSHMNSYIRCKLMVTEDNPPLKPYDQDAWAALPDAQQPEIQVSLQLLTALHARWVFSGAICGPKRGHAPPSTPKTAS